MVYSCGNSTMQMFVGKAAGSGLFTRRYIGGAWKAWVQYATRDDIPAVPTVSADDNGKVLAVVDGAYKLVTIAEMQ